MCIFQAATRKGSAKCKDHCGLIHEMWSHCLVNRTFPWIVRVATADNIADLPSREAYSLIEKLGGVWRPPCIATLFVDPHSEFALGTRSQACQL